MNELTRTGVYLGAAILLLTGVVVTQPRPQIRDVTLEVGKPFFKPFGPQDAKGMEIVEFDENTSTLKPFKVAQIGGVWSIPSHSNYPSDADKQLAEAAASIIDLKKDAHVESTPNMHALYGVITPDEKLTVGAQGVGKRVRLWDANEKMLADIVLGKEVEGKQGRRYAREPGNDVVYEVAIDTKALTTRFGDWIEPDLMKINTADIIHLGMNEYSIVDTEDLRSKALSPKSKIQLDYNSSEAQDKKWSLNKLEIFNPATQKWDETAMTEDEELDGQKLDEMLRALDDLKIIEVNRKPEGIKADLKLDRAALNDRIVASLQQRGFFPHQVTEDTFELLSNEGEVHVDLKTGVEYVLRFGEIATGVNEAAEEKEAEGEEKAEGDAAKKPGSSRYIMITAQFREDLIPKPEITPLPPKPGAQTDAASETPADAAKKEASAEEAAPDEKVAPKDDAAAEGDKQSRVDRKQEETLLAQADDAAAPEKAAEAQPEDAAKTAEEPKASGAVAGPSAPGEKKEETATPQAPETIKTENDAAAERARIEVENKRKEQDYEAKVKAGKERVEELNRRFGAWYYIISNSEYQKIHLGREDIIKEKERKPGEGNTLQDFETLKKEGVEGAAAAPK